MSYLSSMPSPEMVEELDYEAIVSRKISRVREILKEKGISYQPSEADDLMTLVEADAYEETLLRANLNERIKQMFLVYAVGSNLDHIGATRFGVERLQGLEPKAQIEFGLSITRDIDSIIPKGTLIGDGENTAEVLEDVVIKAGELKADGVAKLHKAVESFGEKLELVLTPLPFVSTLTQMSSFVGGADIEDDQRYRDRIWLSRERKTTAGSSASYEYWAKSADVRVQEANVTNGGAGVVKVVVLGKEYETSDDLVTNVLGGLNSTEIRPLTDKVEVEKALIKEIYIDATLIARDLSLVDLEAVKRRFDPFSARFGVYLSMPKVYDLLTDENIIDVDLRSPLSGIKCEFNEVLRFGFNLGVENAS